MSQEFKLNANRFGDLGNGSYQTTYDLAMDPPVPVAMGLQGGALQEIIQAYLALKSQMAASGFAPVVEPDGVVTWRKPLSDGGSLVLLDREALGFEELPCGNLGNPTWAAGREHGDGYIQVDGQGRGMNLAHAIAVVSRLPSPESLDGIVGFETLDEALAGVPEA